MTASASDTGNASRARRAPTGRLLAAIAAALVASSLSFKLHAVFSRKVLPDADESVVGIMALRLLEKGEAALYFPGQAYGAGAGIEALGAALLSAMGFGPQAAVKMSALAIWIVAIALGALAAKRLAAARDSSSALPARAALFSIALLAAAPAAALWGMKLRGGHLPALALLMAATVSFPRLGNGGPPGPRALAFGALLALSVWAQPVALPAAAALLAIAIGPALRGRDFRPLGLLLAGPWLVAALWLVTAPADPVWTASSPRGGAPWEPAGPAALKFLALLFTPYLDGAGKPGLVEIAAGVIWGIAILVALALGLVPFLLGRDGGQDSDAPGPALATPFTPLSLAVTAAPIAAAAVFAAAMDKTGLFPRHLLSAYPFMAITAGLFLAGLSIKRPMLAALVLALLGASGLAASQSALSKAKWRSQALGYELDAASVGRTVERLLEEGETRVYCADPDFHWTLIYLSEGRIAARSFRDPDRYNDYIAEVDLARSMGEPVPVVVPNFNGAMKLAMVKRLLAEPGARPERIGDDIVIIRGLPPEVLSRLFR